MRAGETVFIGFIAFIKQTLSDLRLYLFFFFQAEDGIRDKLVTGVQTCALPIFDAFLRKGILSRIKASTPTFSRPMELSIPAAVGNNRGGRFPSIGRADVPFTQMQIGRASCRERV